MSSCKSFIFIYLVIDASYNTTPSIAYVCKAFIAALDRDILTPSKINSI